MAFFSEEQKELARSKSAGELKREYKRSEKALKAAAKTGSTSAIARVMTGRHRDVEYALLYQTKEKARRKHK